MLSVEDVGHRVVIRQRVGLRDGRPTFRDTLGELIEMTSSELVVSAHAGLVRIAVANVHRAKRIPHSLRDIQALERVAARAWPPVELAELGGWLLRQSGGFTGRANAALPLGDPGRPLDVAVDQIVDWYTARGQRPIVDVPMPLSAPVDAVLRARGWPTLCTVAVQTAPLAVLRARVPAPPASVRLVLVQEPPADWVATVATRRNSDPDIVRQVLTGTDQTCFAVAYSSTGESDELLGAARGTVDGDWLGLFALETAPSVRRQGLAQRLTGALADWAVERGASRAYLQVEDTNTAARALYTRLGFTTHHTYVRRGAPQ